MWKCSEAAAEQIRLSDGAGQVAFSRAVYEEHAMVEGMEAVLAENFEEAETKQSREKALDILKRYFDGTETQTARIKERVFLKMQTRHSIM